MTTTTEVNTSVMVNYEILRVIKSCIPYVSKDELRPAMQYIYYDTEREVIVATNAFIMAVHEVPKLIDYPIEGARYIRFDPKYVRSVKFKKGEVTALHYDIAAGTPYHYESIIRLNSSIKCTFPWDTCFEIETAAKVAQIVSLNNSMDISLEGVGTDKAGWYITIPQSQDKLPTASPIKYFIPDNNGIYGFSTRWSGELLETILNTLSKQCIGICKLEAETGNKASYFRYSNKDSLRSSMLLLMPQYKGNE